MAKNKRVILISLNELNFKIIEKYILKNKLHSFDKINQNITSTVSEIEYKKLEPWIQWVSIYYGLKAKDHKVERLGDFYKGDKENIFQSLEKKGFKVGAISPMNLENNLNNPSYFIPDPWTDTSVDNNFWSKIIYSTISDFVKNNVRKKINIFKYLILLFCFIKFAKIKNYYLYLKIFISSFKKKWFRALFLDLLLHDIHLKKLNENHTHFSNIFFNSLAHIQHHYFFNSIETKEKNPEWYVNKDENPLLDGIVIFENILNDYLKLSDDYIIIVATGLYQVPYDRIKYYYRFKKHINFFQKFNLKDFQVQELMSRDFVLKFNNSKDAEESMNKIKNIKTDKGLSLFGDISLNENQIFLTLIINKKINVNDIIVSNSGEKISLIEYVDFVAIKNGMHNGMGYAYINDRKFNEKLEIHNLKEKIEKIISDEKY